MRNVWYFFTSLCGAAVIVVTLLLTLAAVLEPTGLTYFDWVEGGGFRVGTGEKPIIGVWP